MDETYLNMSNRPGYERMQEPKRQSREFTESDRISANIENARASVSESVDELRGRLESMKRLMDERQSMGLDNSQLFQGKGSCLKGAGLITGNFLSFVFGSALCVIIGVSIYAFYNLYHAVLKRFPSKHTEL